MKIKSLIFIILMLIILALPNSVRAAKVSVGKVENLSTGTITTNSIELKWDKVEGASYYQIYRYNYTKEQYQIYKRTDNTSVKAVNLNCGQKYTFKVRAYKEVNGKKYYGSFSEEIDVSTNPAQVKNFRAEEIKTTTMELKWDKVKGASYYQVYKYNYTKEEYQIYKRTDKNTVGLTNLTSGQKYKFKVRAYRELDNKKYYGSFSEPIVLATNPGQVKNIETTFAAANYVIISWPKVARATAHRIYMYDENTKDWEYYGNAQTNTFKVDDLEPEKEYKIKVVAYRKVDGVKYLGEFSKETKIKTAEKLKVTDVEFINNTEKNITITWSKLSSAYGYQVYKYIAKDKKWQYYKGTTSNSLKIIKKETEDCYTFKVRAFSIDEDKRYYGPFSSSVTYNKLGLDVSKWQDKIDWEALSETALDFVVIRAGYRGWGTGKIVEDEYFEENVKMATKLGFRVGVYFYSYAITEEEAIEEAEWCIDLLKEYGVQDKVKYIAHDFEEYGWKGRRAEDVTLKQMNQFAIAFLQTVKENGYTPILYANKNYFKNYYEPDRILEEVPGCRIWLAHYTSDGSLTDYDGIYDMWQYTSTGEIDGIDGYADLNVVYF